MQKYFAKLAKLPEMNAGYISHNPLTSSCKLQENNPIDQHRFTGLSTKVHPDDVW